MQMQLTLILICNKVQKPINRNAAFTIMFVCLCKNITDTQIRQSVANGAATLHDVRKTLGVATQCGKCLPDARAVINDALDQQSATNNQGNPLVAFSSALFFPAECQR